MISNDSDDTRSTAVDQLEAFGLSAYAARTFVALASLGEGTAKDVSALAEVPRTRVYDATAELRKLGLVDVQQSTPKRFTAVSAETTGRRFRREYTRRADALTEALSEMEPVTPNAEQRGVWTVTGREMVSDRVVEFVDDASDDVVLVTLDALLTDDVVDALQSAADRDVAVHVSGMDFSATDSDDDRLPDGCGLDSPRAWSGVPAGRLLMVDRRRTLASVLVDGEDEHPSGARDETAIWGAGENNSLVVVLKAMFGWLNGNIV